MASVIPLAPPPSPGWGWGDPAACSPSAEKGTDKCHAGDKQLPTGEHTDDTFWRLSGKLQKEAVEGRTAEAPLVTGGARAGEGSFAELCFSFQTGGWGNATEATSSSEACVRRRHWLGPEG